MSLAACCAAALLRYCHLCERLAIPQGAALRATSSAQGGRAACALLGCGLQSPVRVGLQQCNEHRSEMGVCCFSNMLSKHAGVCYHWWPMTAVGITL